MTIAALSSIPATAASVPSAYQPSTHSSATSDRWYQMPEDYRGLQSLFLTLQQEDAALKDAIQVNHYKAGTCVATADELSTNLYMLIKGKLNLICRNEQTGIQIVITTLEPGAIFGQGSVSNLGKSVKFVEAMENVTLWKIAPEAAAEAIARHPILRWGLLQTYAARLAQVEDRLEAVAHKKLPTRLAELLLKLADDRQELLGVSHQMLADHLGTYRETVSSILRMFKQEGLLVLGYRWIKLRDLEALREVAGIW